MADSNPRKEPQCVRLTEDFLDLPAGFGLPAGTVLFRSPHGTGQYLQESTKLGQACVTMFSSKTSAK